MCVAALVMSWVRNRSCRCHARRVVLGLCVCVTEQRVTIRGEEGIAPEHTARALKMSECINRTLQHGQKTQNKILADHFLFSWGISRDMPPKGRSKRHLERFTSVSARIRAPMRGHRRFLPIMAISPTFRPATTPPHDTTRERHHAIRTRKRSADISLNAIARSPW